MAVGWYWPLSIVFSLHTKKITHQASNFEHCLKNCQLSAILTSVGWFCAPVHARLCTYAHGCWLVLAFINWVFTAHQKNNPPSIQLSSIVWRIINFPQFLPASADSVHHRVQGGVPTPKLVGGFWHLGNVVSSVGSTIMICQVCEEQWGIKV